MKLTARRFDFALDYPEICDWWESRGFPFIQKSKLPPCGIVVDGEGVKMCAGWLYNTDSSIALLEWVVANPGSPVHYKRDALKLLVNTARSEVMGNKELLMSFLAHERLISIFEECGFVKGDHLVSMTARCTPWQ